MAINTINPTIGSQQVTMVLYIYNEKVIQTFSNKCTGMSEVGSLLAANASANKKNTRMLVDFKDTYRISRSIVQ